MSRHLPYNQQVASAVLLHASDNVFCLLRDHKVGESPCLVDAEGKQLNAPSLSEDTPLGHKVALRFIKQNGCVIKYGAVIGRATASILAGDHVHQHNIIGDLQAQFSA